MAEYAKKLERAYELMYKYGWLLSVKRHENYLGDNAQMLWMQIEGELDPLVNYLIDHLQKMFEYWLEYHDHEDAGLNEKLFDDIDTMNDRMLSPPGDLSNKIILFQEALNTAHNTGTMKDYLYDIDVDLNPAFLDALSSDVNTNKWDEDLERILGKKPIKFFEET
jgi:hypothetical protein